MHAHSSPTFARYVAIGDSSTEGIDDPDGQGGYRGWSQRLAERIDAQQNNKLLYANLAIRGLTTRQVRDQQLDSALAMKPDLATLFCGTNDVTGLRFDATTVAADIAHMQRALVDAGATVLSFNLPDLTPLMPLARLIATRIKAMNQALAEASKKSGAILIDFAAYPVATDPRLWSEDRIHANSAGHARIAEALAQALNLPDSNDAWRQVFQTPWHPSLSQKCAAEVRWIIRHLLPWIWQSLRGQSAGDGRTCKRPDLSPL